MADIRDELTLELPFRAYAQRRVGLDIQEAGLPFGHDHGRVVAAVAVIQPPRRQIDPPDEHRHEHHLFVFGGDGLIDLTGNLRRKQSRLGDHAEKILRDGHQQTAGNALSAHIGYAEIEYILVDEIVIEVSSDLLGRSHGCEQINLLPFRERREDARDHRHLDIPGNTQFSFYPLFVRGRAREFVDVARQGCLHVAERPGQLADLVRTLRRRQGFVEASGSDFVRLPDQFAERFELRRDHPAANQQHQQESGDDDGHDDVTQPIQTTENILSRTDDRYAPARRLERLIEYIEDILVPDNLAYPLFSLQHFVSQQDDIRIGLDEGLGENGRIQQFGRVRVDQERPAPTDHDVVGMRIRMHGIDGLR